MNGFSSIEADGVLLWVGDPDCQMAHDAILTWLREKCAPFLPSAREDDNILRGKLGESVGFCVAYWHGYDRCCSFPANALRPFRPNSAIDFDIVWLVFGANTRDDLAVLQEVKTTSGRSLHYADKLVEDYEKLFGTNVRLTLQTRLQDIKNKLEFEQQRPELCPRVSALAGGAPRTSAGIQLLPTLVHERTGTDPRPKMLAIRETLLARGWAPERVEAWAIGLTDLDERLIRLATGRN